MSKKLTFFLAVIIVVSTGIGCFLGFRIWDPLWNPFRPEPEKVIEEMAANLSESQALQAGLRLKADIQNKEEINFEGEFDVKEEFTDNQSSCAFVNFQTKLETQGVEFSLAGEWKSVGENSYLKLIILPDLPLLDLFFQEMGINLSEAKDQWLKLDPAFFGDLPENLGRGLKELVVDEDFYLVEQELKDEVIEEKRLYHYLVNFNNAKIRTCLASLGRTLNVCPTGKPFLKDLIVRFWPVLNEAIEERDSGKGEMWIGKDDLSLYRIKGEAAIGLNQVGETGGGTIRIDFEVLPLY